MSIDEDHHLNYIILILVLHLKSINKIGDEKNNNLCSINS